MAGNMVCAHPWVGVPKRNVGAGPLWNRFGASVRSAFRAAGLMAVAVVFMVATVAPASAQTFDAEFFQQAGNLVSSLISTVLLVAVLLGLLFGYRHARRQGWIGAIGAATADENGAVSALGSTTQSTFQRISQTFFNEVLTNWRLVLLGITGIVLSLASGWTTWDGMTDFTCPGRGQGAICITPAILSFMITFGIQGVMLIAAWLIGETFASSFTGKSSRAPFAVVGSIGAVVAGLLVVSVVLAFATDRPWQSVFADSFEAINAFVQTETPGWTTVVVVLAGVMAAAVAFGSKELFGPYMRGIKTVLANMPLWLMFAACMATSVFFSFNSLFSSIFPPDERERAAELRVRNQVAGVISDVETRIGERRVEAVSALFRSPEWESFNSDLTGLIEVAQKAPDELENLKLERVGRQTQAQQEQEASKSAATAKRSVLVAERDRLMSGLEGADAAGSPAAGKVADLEGELQAKKSEIIKAEADMRGEAQGVRGTGQAGRGPKWRALRDKVNALRLDEEEIEGRLDIARRQLARQSDRMAASTTRLQELATEIARLDGEVRRADESLTILRQRGAGTAVGQDIDALGGAAAMAAQLVQFRRDPTKEQFDQVQNLCGSLRTTVASVPSLATQIETINCEPSGAADSASRVFTFNAALATYAANCNNGDRLGTNSIDELLAFGGQCIQSAGLPGTDTAGFRAELNSVALNRDDKAHPLVVTVNAFQDGNRLAYLALAIAIAIDGLVFMSGLFGANAVRSPLADAPMTRARSVSDLEDAITSALEFDNSNAYGTAQLVLGAMSPIKETPEGYTIYVDLTSYSSLQQTQIRNVMTAGGTMGLTAPDPHAKENKFFVRPELYEFLASYCTRRLKLDPNLRAELREKGASQEAERDALNRAEASRAIAAHVTDNEFKRVGPLLEDATAPYYVETANSVLRVMEPIWPKGDFAAYVYDPLTSRDEDEDGDEAIFGRRAAAQCSHMLDFTMAMNRMNQMAKQAIERHLTEEVRDQSEIEGMIDQQIADVMRSYEDIVRHVLNVGASENVVFRHTFGGTMPSLPPNMKATHEVFVCKPSFHKALTKLRRIKLDEHADRGGENNARDLALRDIISLRTNSAVQNLKHYLPRQAIRERLVHQPASGQRRLEAPAGSSADAPRALTVGNRDAEMAQRETGYGTRDDGGASDSRGRPNWQDGSLGLSQGGNGIALAPRSDASLPRYDQSYEPQRAAMPSGAPAREPFAQRAVSSSAHANVAPSLVEEARTVAPDAVSQTEYVTNELSAALMPSNDTDGLTEQSVPRPRQPVAAPREYYEVYDQLVRNAQVPGARADASNYSDLVRQSAVASEILNDLNSQGIMVDVIEPTFNDLLTNLRRLADFLKKQADNPANVDQAFSQISRLLALTVGSRVVDVLRANVQRIKEHNDFRLLVESSRGGNQALGFGEDAQFMSNANEQFSQFLQRPELNSETVEFVGLVDEVRARLTSMEIADPVQFPERNVAT